MKVSDLRKHAIVPVFICISLIILVLAVALPVAMAETMSSHGQDGDQAPTPTPTATTNPETPTPPAIPSTPTPTPTMNTTPTPPANASITPTIQPSASPAPTPALAPRKVFGVARWDTDHVSIPVTNTGSPIIVEAYIGDPTNNNTVEVNADSSLQVNTNSIQAQDGDVIDFGFEAYENGTLIDSIEKSVTAGGSTQVSPTMPPETAILSGTVLDSSSGGPIANASISLTSKTYDKVYSGITTGSDGTFQSPPLYPDYYYITVHAAGFQPILDIQTDNEVDGNIRLNPIKMDPLSTAPVTPTPSPTPVTTTIPASPTPTVSPTGSILDSWIALISSPQACCATAAGGIGVIVSLTALYEWILKQRERRLGKQK